VGPKSASLLLRVQKKLFTYFASGPHQCGGSTGFILPAVHRREYRATKGELFAPSPNVERQQRSPAQFASRQRVRTVPPETWAVRAPGVPFPSPLVVSVALDRRMNRLWVPTMAIVYLNLRFLCHNICYSALSVRPPSWSLVRQNSLTTSVTATPLPLSCLLSDRRPL
jgi:hypothetical protein